MNDASAALRRTRRARIPAGGGLRTWRRLLGYLAPYRGRFFAGILGGVLFSATMASFALFAKKFGDGTFTHRDPRTIVWVPLALIGLFVLRGIGDFTQTYFMGYVGRRIVSELRREIFRRILQLPIGFFDRNSAATLLSRLTYNTEQIGQAATDSVIIVIRTALTILGSVAFLLWLNPRLALVSLTMGPLVGWLVSLINRHFRRYSRRIQDSMGDVTRVAKESFEAPRLIKVYDAQEHLGRQFDAVNDHNLRSNMKLVLTRGVSNPTVQLVTAVGLAFVLSIAIADAIHGRMGMGDLLGFFTALVSIAQPLRQAVGVSAPLQQGIAAAQSLFELLDEPAEPAGGALRVARVRGAVRFEAVSFDYAAGMGPPHGAPHGARRAAALTGVSLEVPAGATLAIVGRSGSGKSTLVNLLPRFYDVSAGRVCIDGRDVREYRLENLREQIALVSQDVVLFDDTIRNNIAFGRAVPDAAIERAAEAAHILEFVRTHPAGLDAMVGDRGMLLSGGQRQRIAIARALLKDAPILILDEATSALDTEAERHIQAALAQLVANRTTFVIAHRLSTVEQADRIIVLEAGRIAESGTHAELIARGGLYAQLHRLQFSGLNAQGQVAGQWLTALWYGGRARAWLLPLACLYRAMLRVRRGAYAAGWRRTHECGAPVVVIGNLTVGGTGKTPLTIWLAQQLAASGMHVGVVSRGYGRTGRGLRRVGAGSHWREVGDEPLLIARHTGCPVMVGSDRVAAARALTAAGAQVIVADDGLQHERLRRVCEIVVIDGARGFGNGALLPAGPLREPPERLARVDAVVINGAPPPAKSGFSALEARDPLGKTRAAGVPAQPCRMAAGENPPDAAGAILPGGLAVPATRVFGMRLVAEAAVPLGEPGARRALDDFRGERVHAVAAIGNPQRFFGELRARGLTVIEHAFPDHHPLRRRDLEFADALPVLMTEKDAVKCTARTAARLWCVPVRAWFDAAASRALMERVWARLGSAGDQMDARLLEILACPVCKGTLKFQREAQVLVCRLDRLAYPIRDQVPVMLEEEARQLAADDPLLER